VTPLDSLALSRGTVDRLTEKRADPAWLEAAWADPGTRVLVVSDGQVDRAQGAATEPSDQPVPLRDRGSDERISVEVGEGRSVNLTELGIAVVDPATRRTTLHDTHSIGPSLSVG